VQRQPAIYQANYMNQMKYDQHTTNKMIISHLCEGCAKEGKKGNKEERENKQCNDKKNREVSIHQCKRSSSNDSYSISNQLNL